jgi:hypothetical protein
MLYGSPEGAWLVLRGPYGRVPLIDIAGLTLLGDTQEVIHSVLAHRMRCTSRSSAHEDVGAYVRRTFAAELGVNEVQLASYDAGRSEPELSNLGWSKLASAYCFISVSV